MTDKRIPQANIRKDTRVSKPRNPESLRLPEGEGLIRDENARAKLKSETVLSRPATRNQIPDFRINNPLFRNPARTSNSIIDNGIPVISPVDETDDSRNQDTTGNTGQNGQGSGSNNTRTDVSPPVTFNPNPSTSDPSQIPTVPGTGNLPREWQNLPPNFQSQIRRLLPIYSDIAGSNPNLRDVPVYVPPPLFDTTPTFEGETGEETFAKDENMDFAPYEPPNRSNLDFLNLLSLLFNLIQSADSDIYEVVSFTRVEEGGATSPNVPDVTQNTSSESRLTSEVRDFPDGNRRTVFTRDGVDVGVASSGLPPVLPADQTGPS